MRIAIVAFACALMIPSVGAGQRQSVPAAPADTKVNVAIALQVAGQPYQFDGKAACQHAPMASVNNVVAEMWMIRQSDAQRSMALTMWRPKNKAGDMFSLILTSRGKSYIVNTVKTSGGGTAQGSGSVTLTPSGTGGAFTLGAKTGNGVAITGTIKCSAFTAAIPEGGNWPGVQVIGSGKRGHPLLYPSSSGVHSPSPTLQGGFENITAGASR